MDIGNHERLQEEHRDLVGEDFDYVHAGAGLLGRDIAKVLGKRAIVVLRRIIDEQTTEGDRYPLVEDMSKGGSGELFEENLALLNSLRQGITDILG